MAATKLENLIKHLVDILEFNESYLAEKARKKSEVFTKVLAMDEDELRNHVAGEGLTQEMALARLKGENIDTISWWHKALWDVEFNTDELKALSFNDGQCAVLRDVFEKLGQKELARRAYMAIYNED
jgi:hypothetical protein